MTEKRVEREQKKETKKTIEERTGLRVLLSWATLFGIVYGELDERLSIKEALEKALKKPVPPHAWQLFCLGGISFFLFILQAITGTLLMFYYRPTVAEAFSSVQYINNYVPFGWLVRGIHSWGSTLMIIAVFLHMLNVFIRGAYRHPRDFTWVSGVFLFMMTLTFGFTGYLLPWTQLSYWATTVGTELPGAIPVVGEYIKIFIRGGTDVTGATLTRFFAIHVLILPFFITFFLAAHFLMVRRLGIAEPL